jgi:APA family basic amino acid/polyamine antiporter
MAINELSAKQLSDLRDHPDLARLPEAGSGDDGTRVGLPTATALVTGSIIGTGIFTVPAALAGFGTIGLLAFVIVAIGAMALAALFATLASKRPAAGGPYAYARDAFGDFGGFTTAWSYWLTSWAGNAAIVTGWVLYVAAFFSGWLGWSLTSGTDLFLLALLGLWIPAVINLSGVRQMGWFQVATTVVKFLPLAFLAVFGLFFIESAKFGPFNVSGTNWFDAISAAGVVVLFSFLGVETASVAAGKVRNPARNVPRATLIGTAASAVVYILCTVAIFGVVGTSALTQSGAPFADAFSSILGSTDAGTVVALLAAISGFGCLVGWTLICGEMPYAAAKDGLFPKAFARTIRGNVPWFGITVSTVLAMVFTWISYGMPFFGGYLANEATGLDVFLTLVYLTGVTAAIPYFFSALAQIYWLFTDGDRPHGGRLARDLSVSVLAMLFSVWFVYGSGAEATYWAFLMLLVGFVVYAVMLVKRTREAHLLDLSSH